MPAQEAINELKKRFKPEAARNLTATYLINIKGQDGGAFLTCIDDGKLEFIPHQDNSSVPCDCTISVDADDLKMIMDGRMSAMTAALSGALAVDGELGLAMKLVPIFFEG